MGQAKRKREMERATTPEKGKGRVVLGYVHGSQLTASFHDTIVQLLVYDMSHEGRIVGGGGRVSQYSSANISNARNNIVRRFLDESDAEWFFSVDTDMSFPPETLDRLLEQAYKHGVPIVGGLCFGQADGELFPTTYLLSGDAEHPKMVRLNAWPRRVEDNEMHPLIPVSATGAACVLIHRSVLEAMREKFPEPYPWFREEILGEPPWGAGAPGTGSAMGEDITFMLRAGVLGFPVHVHVDVEVGHEKSWLLIRDQYDDQRAALAATREEPHDDPAAA